MANSVIEADYPISFRQKEAAMLGEQLRHHNSVNIVGMKRVGISNFLRFFLYNKDIAHTYIQKDEKHVFIPVDLNDLVEREIFPFWTLTLKRIVDLAERLELPKEDKQKIESLFLRAIQTQDVFLAIDSIRQSLRMLINSGYMPTIFFLRFDRIKDSVTPVFFDNLHGLLEATHHKSSFVFTSYRSLDQLSPQVFPKALLSAFAQPMYMQLANSKDTEIIYKTYAGRYGLELTDALKQALLGITHGYVQYLQLSMIVLNEQKDKLPTDEQSLFDILSRDERIYLQSEELWESLTEEEKQVLLQVFRGEKIDEQERIAGKYIWDTGFVIEKNGKPAVFSRLFAVYLEQLGSKAAPPTQSVHFSRKEHALMRVLEQHKNEICEREQIIESVWPESLEIGISDWAIDRLVARVRVKLKQQNSAYEIKTVRTRGYQLVEK